MLELFISLALNLKGQSNIFSSLPDSQLFVFSSLKDLGHQLQILVNRPDKIGDVGEIDTADVGSVRDAKGNNKINSSNRISKGHNDPHPIITCTLSINIKVIVMKKTLMLAVG